MTFKEQLEQKLKDKIKEENLKLLPTGFQRIGEIIILNLKPELNNFKKEIGQACLELFPKIKTIFNKTGEITGEFREPQIEILAFSGKNPITEAITTENACKYKFDVTKVMFAKGNLNERVRIAKQVKKTEIILDMFAGIGYFSVPIGVIGKPKKVYSIEKNPNSVYYLKENLKLNKIENIFEVFNEDNRIIIEQLAKKGIKVDRIVMGYLPPPMEFFEDALKLAKKGTILHYECLISDELEKKNKDVEEIMKQIENKAKNAGLKIKLLSINYVKGYRPRINHEVLDLEII